MTGQRTMEDMEGQEICGYRKKMLSMHATAYITIKMQGKVMVVATVKQQSSLGLDSSADIYIHDPPMSYDTVTTKGLSVSIHVEGDIRSKKYDFMMDNFTRASSKGGYMVRNPYKIAQVVRTSGSVGSDNNHYYIEIGPNVDFAFISMCAYAIDELFSDDWKYCQKTVRKTIKTTKKTESM